MINFSKPSLGDEEIEAVSKVLKSGWLAAGPEVEAFEREFADYVGVKYAIFTNSCTSALKMAYKWAKEEAYYELGYPKNTFCATYSAMAEMGIKPVPYSDSFKISEEIVVVHYGGVKDETPCLIEDSAHRIEPNDPLVGKIRCYSFYVTKNMTTGAGGMFTTNDKEIYEKARLYWKDGLSTSTRDRLTGNKGWWEYEVLAMAGGYDGNDIAATIGRAQLRKLPEFTRRRNEIVARYNEAFGQNWTGNHLYPYFVKNKEEIGKLINHLKDNGIQAGYHYPGTGWLGVSLPLYPDMSDSQVEEVIKRVKDYERLYS